MSKDKTQQITFRQAIINTQKLCTDNPDAFKLGCVGLKKWDEGEFTLVGAVAWAVAQAYEAGRTGKKLDLPSLEDLKADSGSRLLSLDYVDPTVAPARPVRHVRSAPAPVQQPTPRRRFTRS